MIKKLQKDKKGFTLVELVVVIAILAILAALLVPRIMGNVNDARVSRSQANARTIASEITTHNALARVNGTATIPTTFPVAPATHSVDGSELGLIGRGTADINDLEGLASITIDEDGNATVGP